MAGSKSKSGPSRNQMSRKAGAATHKFASKGLKYSAQGKSAVTGKGASNARVLAESRELARMALSGKITEGRAKQTARSAKTGKMELAGRIYRPIY